MHTDKILNNFRYSMMAGYFFFVYTSRVERGATMVSLSDSQVCTPKRIQLFWVHPLSSKAKGSHIATLYLTGSVTLIVKPAEELSSTQYLIMLLVILVSKFL